MEKPEELLTIVEYPALFHRISYHRTAYDTLSVTIEGLGSNNGEDELILSGGIRFDGCSNWGWAELGVHWCEFRNVQQLADTLKHAYLYAQQFYGESWCGDYLTED